MLPSCVNCLIQDILPALWASRGYCGASWILWKFSTFEDLGGEMASYIYILHLHIDCLSSALLPWTTSGHFMCVVRNSSFRTARSRSSGGNRHWMVDQTGKEMTGTPWYRASKWRLPPSWVIESWCLGVPWYRFEESAQLQPFRQFMSPEISDIRGTSFSLRQLFATLCNCSVCALWRASVSCAVNAFRPHCYIYQHVLYGVSGRHWVLYWLLCKQFVSFQICSSSYYWFCALYYW